MLSYGDQSSAVLVKVSREIFAERSESNILQQGPHRAPLLRGSPEGSGGRPAKRLPGAEGPPEG